MPVALAEPLDEVLLAEIVPLLVTDECDVPETESPVDPVMVPLLVTLCPAVPVTLNPVCVPPLIVPLLTTPVAGEPTLVGPRLPDSETIPSLEAVDMLLLDIEASPPAGDAVAPGLAPVLWPEALRPGCAALAAALLLAAAGAFQPAAVMLRRYCMQNGCQACVQLFLANQASPQNGVAFSLANAAAGMETKTPRRVSRANIRMGASYSTPVLQAYPAFSQKNRANANSSAKPRKTAHSAATAAPNSPASCSARSVPSQEKPPSASGARPKWP
jgi:hypothetical protein